MKNGTATSVEPMPQSPIPGQGELPLGGEAEISPFTRAAELARGGA